ncbi:hypothetical protein HMPREF9065_01421 [Aggregatibacter sp. oral taxon 458 str. W10330]|uniref:AbiTii domain-containing protein n=1 Tax=Aggregatibacter sp. oral taxon 458 TaxID=712148 RepID=UPI0003965710|nr:hypothetical protein [Aggregatibacter sp. oral taxon 458]ERH27364.1 hypothetical protein HMPREF9065_01421 [Aggregatibacter sp. oral taxon 458 str. W10330]
MSLLRDIQDLASSSSKDIELSTLLRKCKILATRLNHPGFKSWVENELNGYNDVSSLPSYRVLKVISKGHFSTWGNSILTNIQIHTHVMKEKHEKYVKKAHIMQGIGSLENLLSKEGSIFQSPWDSKLLAIYASDFYNDMICIKAWQVISSSDIAGIIDTVKTKILDFALEIEAENPNAGDIEMNSNPIDQNKITQIFNTTINGNVQNVATGSSDVNQNSQINNTAKEELFSNLLDIISNQKVSLEEEQYQNILKVINEMRSTQGTSDFSSKYIKFIELINSHAGIFSAIAPYIPVLTKLSGVA